MQSDIGIETLLPYENTVLVKDIQFRIRILHLLSKIILEAISAIDIFYLEGQLLSFDPHVGDNLCQIRAVQFSLFAHERNVYMSTMLADRDTLKFYLKKINNLVEKYSHLANVPARKLPTSVRKHKTLLDFLTAIECHFKINQQTKYLTQSIFLTKYRKVNEQQNIILDYSKMASEFSVSKNILRKLVHQYQIEVATVSTEFVKRIAAEYKHTMYLDLLNALERIDDDGRPVLPCYIVMQILLDPIVSMSTPIIMAHKTASDPRKLIYNIFSINVDSNMKYHSCPLKPELTDKPCIVFHGLKESTDMNNDGFRLHGAIKPIMANMASHPQYSGYKLIDHKKNPYAHLIDQFDKELRDFIILFNQEFLALKDFSSLHGCQKSYSALFFARHIFCDTLSSQIDLLENGIFYSDISASHVAQVAKPANVHMACEI